MNIKRYMTALLICLCAASFALSVDPKMTNVDRGSMTILKGSTEKRNRPAGGLTRAKLRPPSGLIVANEGIWSMGFKIKPSPDDNNTENSLVMSYTYGIGGLDATHPNYPGEITGVVWTNIREITNSIVGYSLQELNDLCDAQKMPRLKVGDQIYLCVKADAVSGYQDDSDWLKVPMTITKPTLGAASNNVTWSFGNMPGTNGWTQAAKDSVNNFLSLMMPIIKETYGAPSHTNNIGLIKDKTKTAVNMYMSDPNEIWMLNFNTQLLTHELIHGFRDFAALSTSPYWHYDPWLMGFEEGFAQAVSYWCMDRFAERYPNDPIWEGKPAYYLYSNRNYSYDYDNTDIITTKDYWSSGNADATGLGFRRYEMGAMAFHKIFMEDNAFPKHFNEEYYKRMNADPDFYPTRDNVIDMFEVVLTKYGKNGAKIEGRKVRDWVNRQRIFDSKVKAGCKIYNNSYYHPSTDGYYHLGSVYYYETFSDGSEWGTIGNNQWQFHKVNGASGYSKLIDWNGNAVNKYIKQTFPIEQPDPAKGSITDPSWKMASYPFTVASVDFAKYKNWYKDALPKEFMQAKNFGLYTLEHNLYHPSGTPVTAREYFVCGDQMAALNGVSGAVIDDDFKIGENVLYKNGSIYFKHDGFPNEEGPFAVVNGAFTAKVQWTKVDSPFPPLPGKAQKKISKPGTVKIRFVNSATKEESIDYRNIDYGFDNNGFAFLFREKDMLLPNGEVKPTNPSTIEDDNQTVNIDLQQNYPNPFNPQTSISFSLSTASNVELSVFNAKGEEVVKLLNDKVGAGSHSVNFNGAALHSGVYFYKLVSNGQSLTKKMILVK